MQPSSTFRLLTQTAPEAAEADRNGMAEVRKPVPDEDPALSCDGESWKPSASHRCQRCQLSLAAIQPPRGVLTPRRKSDATFSIRSDKRSTDFRV